jgi:hypothetical protein
MDLGSRMKESHESCSAPSPEGEEKRPLSVHEARSAQTALNMVELSCLALVFLCYKGKRACLSGTCFI